MEGSERRGRIRRQAVYSTRHLRRGTRRTRRQRTARDNRDEGAARNPFRRIDFSRKRATQRRSTLRRPKQGREIETDAAKCERGRRIRHATSGKSVVEESARVSRNSSRRKRDKERPTGHRGEHGNREGGWKSFAELFFSFDVRSLLSYV